MCSRFQTPKAGVLKTVVVLLLVFQYFMVIAQPKNDSKNGFSFRNLDRMFGLSSTKNIDTNYYILSPYGWMLNVNNNFATMAVSAELDNPSTALHSELSAHSNPNYTFGVTAGYRNLILGYSFVHPVGTARDMTLAFAGNAWGVEYRRYLNDDMDGQISSSSMTGGVDIKSGNIRVETRYLRAYHVFSPRKFSLTAANDHRCIQLRSAGSLLLFTDYGRHAVDFYDPAQIALFDGVNRFQVESAALGLGYGYNYTPNRGRLLFHVSVVPMFVVMMNECLFSGNAIESDRGSIFRMRWFGRFTANYRFNDHFGINIMAIYNRTAMNADTRVDAIWNDFSVKASLCCRF